MQDVDAVDMCLRAINALASFLYRDKTAGREGLVARTVDSKGSNGELQENISSHFLRLLLQLILFEDFRLVNFIMIAKKIVCSGFVLFLNKHMCICEDNRCY